MIVSLKIFHLLKSFDTTDEEVDKVIEDVKYDEAISWEV